MAKRISGSVSDLVILQDAAVATGDGTALSVQAYNGVVFDVTIADTATITFEQQTDTAWAAIQCMNPIDGTLATTATATGTFVASCFGYQNVRARISGWTAGAVTVKARAEPNAPSMNVADVEVTSSGEVTSLLPGTGASNLGKAEDAQHTSGDVGVLSLGVRADTAASTATTDGDYTAPIFDSTGRLWARAIPYSNSGSTPDVRTVGADGTSNSNVGFIQHGFNYLFNGTSWDRSRSNLDATILASAARTVETNSTDQTNYNARGVHVVIDITAGTGGTVTPVIEGKDALSGKYYEILRGAGLTAAGTTVLKVYPGITAAANASVSDILPRAWRVQVEVADTTSYTYSIGASVIL